MCPAGHRASLDTDWGSISMCLSWVFLNSVRNSWKVLNFVFPNEKVHQNGHLHTSGAGQESSNVPSLKNLPAFSFFNTEGTNQPNFLSLGLVMLSLLSPKNFTGAKEFLASFNLNWFLFNPMRSCMFNYHHPYYRWKINFLWCCHANYHLICLAMASHNRWRLWKTKSKGPVQSTANSGQHSAKSWMDPMDHIQHHLDRKSVV